jgi:hypothetical protein
MNWFELKEQIESMTPEQQKMKVVLVDEWDEFVDVDDAIWWNMDGHTHTGCTPTANLKHTQPYLTIVT